MDRIFCNCEFNERNNLIVTFLFKNKSVKCLHYKNYWYYYPSFVNVDTETEEWLNEQLLIHSPNNSPIDETIKIETKKENTNKVRFVVSSSLNKEEFKSSPFMKSMPNLNCLYGDRFHFNLENKIGLSQLYNSYLHNKVFKDNILVFVHDDVILEDIRICEKLIDAHSTYDVVGLAGAKNIKLQSPCLWHRLSPNPNWNDKGDLRGSVSHIFPDGNSNMSHFGHCPDEVDVIDGLFISINVKSILDTNVEFDEDFDFHFYDMAFCMRAKRAKLKIGVYPIFVQHYGLGHTDKNWAELEQNFLNKYK